jgi:phytoene/squalene synthetase
VKPLGGRGNEAHHDNETSLALYDSTAADAAATVIRRYSTSFGTGTRLLPAPMRHHIEAVYAMVRIGDEVVDTYRGPDARELLDAFEAEVHEAMERGFSTNVIAHAFATTARAVGISQEQTVPYFASMRMDLEDTTHTQESFERYVFGSAEVVGEMCLAVFVNTDTGPRPLDPTVREGARRLGAGYQKINFLRDLAMDDATLGRSYFPDATASSLTDEQLATLVADCETDIAAARACLPALPRGAAIAVRTTIDIYTRLLATIARTPAHELVSRRIRVADPVKYALAARNSVLPARWLAS